MSAVAERECLATIYSRTVETDFRHSYLLTAAQHRVGQIIGADMSGQTHLT